MANTIIGERQVTLAGENTAYHEAGHAVVALACGLQVRRVSIIRNGNKLGSCFTAFPSSFTVPVPKFKRDKRDKELFRRLTEKERKLYVEREARKRESTVALAGRAVSDLRRGWNLQNSLYLLEESAYLSIRLSEENIEGQTRDIQTVMRLADYDAKSFKGSKRYLLQAYSRARKLIEQPQYWRAIDEVAGALLQQGILNGEEVASIYSFAKKRQSPRASISLNDC